MKIEGRYLGDGVYASFDGYQIWLAANHHENKVIAIDSDTMRRLVEYTNDIYKTNARLKAAIDESDRNTPKAP